LVSLSRSGQIYHFFFKSEGDPLCNQMYKNYDIKNVS
jgi:hypothetical protein